jgi:hypothetical protein
VERIFLRERLTTADRPYSALLIVAPALPALCSPRAGSAQGDIGPNSPPEMGHMAGHKRSVEAQDEVEADA